MRKKLIFIFVLSAMVVGCGSGDNGTSGGAGSGTATASEAQVALIAQGNSTINATIGDVDVIQADAQDSATINIDQTTPQEVFTGIETTPIQPDSIEAASACDDPALSPGSAAECRAAEANGT